MYTRIPESSTYTLTPGHEKPFYFGKQTNFFCNPIHFKAFDNAVGDAHEPVLFILMLVYGVFAQFSLFNHWKMFSRSHNVVSEAANSLRYE